MFFLNLYYTFITYDGPKGNEQRVESNEKRAKSNEQRGKITEQRGKSKEQRAKSFTSKFTKEEEGNGESALFGISLKGNNGKISILVYTKPTHIDQYLH